MSRIDATVATQAGDISRPRQAFQDQQAQVKQAQSVETEQAASGSRPVSADDVRAAAAQIKQVIEAASGRKLSFDIDEDLEEVIVVVKDQAGEVVRQIPSEEMMALQKRLDELVGVLLDKSA
jgi:flagellar protein FlaG